MNTRSLMYFILLATIPLLLAGCGGCALGTGEFHTEERLFPNCEGISVDCDLSVRLRNAEENEWERVILLAQPSILPLVMAKVQHHVLNISTAGCLQSPEQIEIEVVHKHISGIRCSAKGIIQSTDTLQRDTVRVVNSGTGVIDLLVNADYVEVNLLSDGHIKLGGSTNGLMVTTAGSGSCNASTLKSRHAQVNHSGSGTVSVYASNSVVLGNNGVGDIVYGGNPQTTQMNVHGKGKITASE